MTSPSDTLPENVRFTLSNQYRLAALKQSKMFGANKLEIFDQISEKASSIFHAPVAQITFLEEDEQWMTSSLGFDLQRSPTVTSFCAHTISHPENPMIVLDALLDERFTENPFVKNPPHIRFYAGTVIRYNEHNIGTLCIYDFKPRSQITSEQATMLLQLAQDAETIIAQLK